MLAVEDIPSFVNYGALGAIVVLFVTGMLVARPIYAAAIERADRAEEKLEAFTRDVMVRVPPVLERAIEVLNSRSAVESEVVEVLTDVRRLLEQH